MHGTTTPGAVVTKPRVSCCPGTTWGTQGQASYFQNYKVVSRSQKCFSHETIFIKWWERCLGIKKHEVMFEGSITNL